MIDTLKPLLEQLGLGHYGEPLSKLARPSVELVTADVPATRCCSRLGGSPDLPTTFQWPSHAHGHYRFLGQMNLNELQGQAGDLPSTGLLSIFYAHDDNDQTSWQDPNYVRAYYFQQLDELKPVEPPAAVRSGSTCTVRLRPSVDIPLEDRSRRRMSRRTCTVLAEPARRRGDGA
jgi:hypothetical protein